MIRYGKRRNPDGRIGELVVMKRKRVRLDNIIRILPVLWEQSNEHRDRDGGGTLKAMDRAPSTTQE